jgi:VanZ family protein
MRSVFLEKPDPAVLRRRMERFGQVRRFLWVWLPPLIAMAIIAWESTDTFSSEHTSHWLRPFLERIFGPIDGGNWLWGHHLLRKTGHFIGYGSVGLTFLRAWLLTLGLRMGLTAAAWRWRSSVLAIVCTALVASADEWHQTFIPSRTGTPWDVLLDTCGAMSMCGLVWLVCWLCSRGSRGPEPMSGLKRSAV